MKIRVLNVGDEVLNGYVVNTNASYISSKINELGFINSKTIVIKDDYEEIKNEVIDFFNSNDNVLITTGGLGPTHDDITKEAIAKALDLELVYYKEAEKVLKNYLGTGFPKCNYKQTYFPKGSILIENKNGTADGAIIIKDEKTIIILVGPPSEMIPMFEMQVVQRLRSMKTTYLLVENFIVMGISEALAEEKTEYLEKKYDVKIALYVDCGFLRLQIKANDSVSFDNAKNEIVENLNNFIISHNKRIEEVVVDKAIALNYKISFAESCTGGLLASNIINVSDASKVLYESYICYNEKIKTKLLNVSEETIKKYSVISKEVAYEMAHGLFKLTNADICVSTTGITGPNNPYKDKPIGLVCYSIKINDDYFTEEKIFKGERNIIRLKAVRWILYRIYLLLK